MATHAMTDPTAAAHHAPARCLVAIELSGASWVIGVLRPEADKISVHTLKSGDADALIALMHKARRRSEWALGTPVAIASCFEAGTDGSGCTAGSSPKASPATSSTRPASR